MEAPSSTTSRPVVFTAVAVQTTESSAHVVKSPLRNHAAPNEEGVVLGPESEPSQAVAKQQARLATLATMPNAMPDERILLELAGSQLPLIALLEDAQTKACERLVKLVDQPNAALAFARLLREVTLLNGNIGKRVAELLQAAANLRTQRRFLQLNSKGGGHDE